MKYFCVFLCALLFSCKGIESKQIIIENSNNSNIIIADELIDNHYEDQRIIVDFDTTEDHGDDFYGDDIKSNYKIIYREESDVIENINEIEPNENVANILDKPFENVKLSVYSVYINGHFFYKIDEILSVFGISISENIINRFNSLDLYKGAKITIENITLYVIKLYDNKFHLGTIENESNALYEPRLKIGQFKNDVISMLGHPSKYSDEKNVFIYDLHKTLRSLHIAFDENDRIKFIQLISSEGI